MFCSQIFGLPSESRMYEEEGVQHAGTLADKSGKNNSARIWIKVHTDIRVIIVSHLHILDWFFSPQAKHHYYIFTVKMLFRQVPSNVVCVLKYKVNKERCLKAWHQAAWFCNNSLKLWYWRWLQHFNQQKSFFLSDRLSHADRNILCLYLMNSEKLLSVLPSLLV